MNIVPFSRELAQSLYNSREQYPVSFDDAWQWLEHSRKDNAKTHFLKCGFIEDIDFRLLKIKETRPDGSFSHCVEEITLTSKHLLMTPHPD